MRRDETPTLEVPTITYEEAMADLLSRGNRWVQQAMERKPLEITPRLGRVEEEEEARQAIPTYVCPDDEKTIELWPGAKGGAPR